MEAKTLEAVSSAKPFKAKASSMTKERDAMAAKCETLVSEV